MKRSPAHIRRPYRGAVEQYRAGWSRQNRESMRDQAIARAAAVRKIARMTKKVAQ